MLSSPLTSWSHVTPFHTWLSLPQFPTFSYHSGKFDIYLNIPQRTQNSHFSCFLPIPYDLLLSSTPFILFHAVDVLQNTKCPNSILLIQPSHFPAYLLNCLYTMILKPRWDFQILYQPLPISFLSYPDYIPLAFMLISLLHIPSISLTFFPSL